MKTIFIPPSSEGIPQSNPMVFADFIRDRKPKALTVEWVLWMLEQLDQTERYDEGVGVRINPDWLRAEFKFKGATPDVEPPMIYDL